MKASMLVLMVCMFATSCSAHPSKYGSRDDSSVSKDSIMRKAVGDSIYSIISNAKKIKAEVLKIEMDSISIQNELFVKSKYSSLVKFVLSNPKIYNVSTSAYGSFMPCFSLTFIKKKESCTAKFDFGLKKWAIFDDKGSCLKKFDLSSDDMLRVADLLFPKNKHFQSLINTEKK